MALKRLLSLIATEGIQPRLETVSRWTETQGNESWDEEPEYGAFVDDEGHVVTGSQPYRAFLESDDPTLLELAPETARKLGDVALVFLDWGRQELSWGEIFELWEAWEGLGTVVDCGAVGVSWNLATRWVSPGWIAFRGSFDGSPLSVTARRAAQKPSFLAKAVQHREVESPASLPPMVEEELPMLPFTIDDLKSPSRPWPQDL